MNRRTLLKNMMVVLFASGAAGSTRRAETFYVAGARFYPPNEQLRVGDFVSLVPATVRGELAYAVQDIGGVRIGWVPRSLIAKIDAGGAHRAEVIEVSLRRVPWRWYRLAVS